MKHYFMEFLGTFFLALAVCITGNPFAIGIMLITMVYIGYHVSGAHYNPAITLAMWMQKKIATSVMMFYMLAQTLGAFLASVVFYNLVNKYFMFSIAEDITFFQASYVEAILTFLLCLVYLSFVLCKKLKGNFVYGLAIGLCFTTIVFVGGPISGAVVNPALGVGLMIPNFYMTGSFGCALVYLVGPFLGGALSAYAYKYLNVR